MHLHRNVVPLCAQHGTSSDGRMGRVVPAGRREASSCAWPFTGASRCRWHRALGNLRSGALGNDASNDALYAGGKVQVLADMRGTTWDVATVAG